MSLRGDVPLKKGRTEKEEIDLLHAFKKKTSFASAGEREGFYSSFQKKTSSEEEGGAFNMLNWKSCFILDH